MTIDTPGRFHLSLTSASGPAAQGWWDSEATARDKFKQWVGEWGRPGARLTLADELTGETLTAWPDSK
jgi:hypothetical protein